MGHPPIYQKNVANSLILFLKPPNEWAYGT